jgi:LacI family xylobiose transport system transcriptional regulator
VLGSDRQPRHMTPSVGATNWSGGIAATRHLLDLGHRRIAVISGPRDYLCAIERLDLPDPPTAVLCGNDLRALGVYEAPTSPLVRASTAPPPSR